MDVNLSYRLDRQSGLNLSLVALAGARRPSGVPASLPTCGQATRHAGARHVRQFQAPAVFERSHRTHHFRESHSPHPDNISQWFDRELLSESKSSLKTLLRLTETCKSDHQGPEDEGDFESGKDSFARNEKKNSNQLCVFIRRILLELPIGNRSFSLFRSFVLMLPPIGYKRGHFGALQSCP